MGHQMQSSQQLEMEDFVFLSINTLLFLKSTA